MQALASIVTGSVEWLSLMLLGLAAMGSLVLAHGAYARYRGKRIMTCPESRRVAGLEVDAAHAALTGVLGWPELRVARCSCWPEAQSCGQACLREIEAAPQDSLISTIVSRWHREPRDGARQLDRGSSS